MGSLMLAMAGPAQAGEGVAVRSTLLSRAKDGKPLALYLEGGDRAQPIPIGEMRFSPEFQLPRMEHWAFGYWTNVAGEMAFEEECRVTPPADSRIWLVFHHVQPEAPGQGEAGDVDPEGDEAAGPVEELPPVLGAHALGIDDLGEGGVMILNLAKREVHAEIGGQSLRVEPSGHALVIPEGEPGERYAVKFHVLQGERKRPFVTTNWFLGEDRRRLATVVEPPGSAVPKLILSDEISREEAPESGE